MRVPPIRSHTLNMDSISPQRKAELMELFSLERYALLDLRALLLAQMKTAEQKLERVNDAAGRALKLQMADISLTLKAIDLAVAYRDTDRAKERYEQVYLLQMRVIGPGLFEDDYRDDEEINRIAAEVNPAIDAIRNAEREEGWQTLLAFM